MEDLRAEMIERPQPAPRARQDLGRRDGRGVEAGIDHAPQGERRGHVRHADRELAVGRDRERGQRRGHGVDALRPRRAGRERFDPHQRRERGR